MESHHKHSYLDRIPLDLAIAYDDELASSIVHIVGFGLSFSAMVLLVVFSALYGTVAQIVSYTLIGFFQILYYLFSVLHHDLYRINAKKIFWILEHCAIYLLLGSIGMTLSLVIMQGNIGLMGCIIFTGLCILGVIIIALNRPTRETQCMFLNSVLFVLIVLFFIYYWSIIPTAFQIWSPLTLAALMLGWIAHGFHGIQFNHAWSHGFYVLASLLLFFGFLFSLF